MIDLTEQQLKALLVQLYGTTNINDTFEHIKSLYKDNIFRIHVVVVESDTDLTIDLNDIYITHSFCHTINCAKLYFNSNSLKSLQYHNINKFNSISHDIFFKIQSILSKMPLYYQELFIFELCNYINGNKNNTIQAVGSNKIIHDFDFTNKYNIEPSAEDFSDLTQFFYFFGIKVRWDDLEKCNFTKIDDNISSKVGGWITTKFTSIVDVIPNTIRLFLQTKNNPDNYDSDFIVTLKHSNFFDKYIQIYNPIYHIYSRFIPDSTELFFNNDNPIASKIIFKNFTIFIADADFDHSDDKYIFVNLSNNQLDLTNITIIKQVAVPNGVIFDFKL